jgi:hypothetical protein
VAAPRRVVPTRRLPPSQCRSLYSASPAKPFGRGASGLPVRLSPPGIKPLFGQRRVRSFRRDPVPPARSQTDPDGVPSLSFRELLAHRMRPSACFHPAGLLAPLHDARPVPFAALPLAGQGRFRGRSGTAGGAIRPYRPPACPAARRGSDSDCEAFAADGGLHHRLDPGNTQAAYCRSRFRLPLAVAVWVVTRRRGLSDRPHLARPSQTYLPCGRPPSGRVAVTFLLHPYRLSPWECTARPGRAGQPSSPDDPWSGPPGGRTPRAAPSLRGRVGLLGQTPFAGGGCPRDGEYPLTGVTPGYP